LARLIHGIQVLVLLKHNLDMVHLSLYRL
jgi:hypothetical protein